MAVEFSSFPAASLPGANDQQTTWNAALGAEIPRARYREVSGSDRHLMQWLGEIRIRGVGLLQGLPPTNGMVLRFLEQIGSPRRIETGACFAIDETPFAEFEKHDRSGRVVHTAAPYRCAVPGLRVLHCLRPADEGGECELVDGLEVARIIALHHKGCFDLLSRSPVPFVRAGRRHHHASHRPVVERDADGGFGRVHYDPNFMTPMDTTSTRGRDLHGAYRCFSRMLNRADLRVRLRLNSGDVLVLDNRRVLYGQSAYQGELLIEHCHADWGDLDSRWRALASTR